MKLIVGLGNPGPRYANTRHNVGFRALEILMEQGDNKIVARYNSLVMETTLHDTSIVLAKPLTYMNNSGSAIAALVNQLEIPLTELCIVYDDIHLDVGVIRMRRKGSDGGHNGMKSIISTLHTTEFPRLRIGIGEPIGAQVDYVLSEFTDAETPKIEDAIQRAVDAVETFVRDGILTAMNRFNGSKADHGDGKSSPHLKQASGPPL